jgi:hypothetical protein
MSGTPRLALPFLSPGQAQKEFTHNEALQTLDFVAAASIEEEPRNDPPSAPVIGACYVVDTSPTGDWAEKPQCFAGYTSGGWRFITPFEGLSAYVKSDGRWATYRSGGWEVGNLRGTSLLIDGEQVVGSRAGAIASPTGGTTVDNQARTTIDQILAILRDHGLIDS